MLNNLNMINLLTMESPPAMNPVLTVVDHAQDASELGFPVVAAGVPIPTKAFGKEA